MEQHLLITISESHTRHTRFFFMASRSRMASFYKFFDFSGAHGEGVRRVALVADAPAGGRLCEAACAAYLHLTTENQTC